jgi:hypothetical protein
MDTKSIIKNIAIHYRNLFRFHIIIGFILIISFFIINVKIYRLFVITVTILILLSYLIFNGCLVTRIEQYLCPNTRTIVDFILEIFGSQVNNKNRNMATKIGFFIIFLSFVIFYYITYMK